MKQMLFRKELEIKAVFFSCLAAIAILIVQAIIIFLWLGEYTRKSDVKSYLAPSTELIKAYPLQPGILIKRKKQEGLLVKQGVKVLIMPDSGLALKKHKNRSSFSNTKD